MTYCRVSRDELLHDAAQSYTQEHSVADQIRIEHIEDLARKTLSLRLPESSVYDYVLDCVMDAFFDKQHLLKPLFGDADFDEIEPDDVLQCYDYHSEDDGLDEFNAVIWALAWDAAKKELGPAYWNLEP